MRTRTIFFIALLIVGGGIIVALPDNNNRLFSLSTMHGPSALDALGLAILFVGYFWLVGLVWRRREKIIAHKNTPWFFVSLLIALSASMLIIYTVMFDHGNWWMLGALLLLIVQGLACVVAFR